MILDHWNPDRRKSRTEAFCYGPKSCRFYRPGPTRKVPGRRGMSFDEGDWVDEQETEHRGRTTDPDELRSKVPPREYRLGPRLRNTEKDIF